MAIAMECPICHRKQKVTNKKCNGKFKGFPCEVDFDKERRKLRRVKYYINYRLDGKQYWEFVGYSLQEARDADAKRRVQKRENRPILEILPESKMTFRELADWYLGLTQVTKLKSFNRVIGALKAFLETNDNYFGKMIVRDIKPQDLMEYQNIREEEGKAPATIDMEIRIAKTMVQTADDNDKIGPYVIKAFKKVKKKLKTGANARKRTLELEEYLNLIDKASPHLKGIIVTAMFTGTRKGDLRELKWSYIDKKNGVIRLPETVTKEGKERIIPINYHVKKVLDNTPRHLNHDYVFTYRGKPITSRDGLKKSYKAACEDAGIPYGRKEPNGTTFHDIRRTVKTNMANAGIDSAHRDVICGHALPRMDRHYIAPSEADLKESMDRFTKWMDEQLEKASSKAGSVNA